MPIGIATVISEGAKIKVIGVGGGGCNAVHNMFKSGLEGIDFIIANTDKQSLDNKDAHIKIQLGKRTTNGLGSGGKPEIGKKSAEEEENDIRESLAGSNMVFVTSGMGGGTGSGASPEVARIARDMGILVVGIVTKPFGWEGKNKMATALNYIESLREYVDALIVIPNQRLLEIIDNNTGFAEAFKKVDDVLYNATKGITEIIGNHGHVNIDFADVTSVMKNSGDAIMGIGYASGEKRTEIALANALNSPLLDGASIRGAKGVLVNFTAGNDLTMLEISEAVSTIHETAGDDVNLKFGVVNNPEMSKEIMVTVVATGFNMANQNKKQDKIVGQLFEDETKKQDNSKKPYVSQTKPLPTKPQIKQPNNPWERIVQTQHNDTSIWGLSKSANTGGFIPATNGFNDVVGAYNPYDSAPRGSEEVKKFDTPAFMRNGFVAQIIEVNGTNRINLLQQG